MANINVLFIITLHNFNALNEKKVKRMWNDFQIYIISQYAMELNDFLLQFWNKILL